MMMGLAIAHHIREQVVFPNDVIEIVPKREFAVEQKVMDVDFDVGSYITII
jgi:hypothetical protein